jgi:hypothetical protein
MQHSSRFSLINSRGANVSHNMILKPLRSGVFNITAAMVAYQPSEDAEQQVRFLLWQSLSDDHRMV